ncbi:pleiotropic drug resistance ABC transporter [Epithele typhae]|uniref:pleiotropic drug resistance ABC transporter n=1 Tax=Epithele typhae TaxID=378194 RepID=UPI00200778E5|nr:pleiotropic drug resistance ABC transporter [Epithele typhae]KAH9945220.1 pleiotropic drug resistance ABC transporter [Epithele typhae]
MSNPSVHSTEGQEALHELPSPIEFSSSHARRNRSSNDPSSPVKYKHGSPLSQRQSTTSHVDIGHFDLEGVERLHRTYTREADGGQAVTQSIASAETLYGDINGSFDFEKTMRNVVREMDRQELKRRELGVLFKDLRVVGVGSSASFQPTLGSVLNPLNTIAELRQSLHPATRDILSGFEGLVQPGEMLLVLGRPGSGCSTLLKVLANQRQEYHKVEGEVLYDSLTPREIEAHYRGDVQYCPEDDIHFPTLTVDQTIRFAAETRTPRQRLGGASREDHISRVTDIVETVFGLRHIKDTLVGNASIRGVSGGERKRVSISEAIVARSLLISWDNSTRGLDASTALEFVQALRIATDIARQSTIVAIYQAGEQLYESFDKVCVVYEGRQVYFGPANRARQYFIDMGFEPANRQTTADYLVAVTDPNGRTVRAGFENRVPRTASEFAAHWARSELAQLNREEMESYREQFVGKPDRVMNYKQSSKAEHAKRANPKSPYIVTIGMQASALMRRRVQIIRGNMTAQVIQVFSFVIQAIIMGTVFLRLENTTAAFFSKGGVLFFAMMFTALSAMAEIPALFSQRPIVQRQSRVAMYHPFVEALALTLVDIPITLVTQIIFSVVLYFLVGLAATASQFFTFFLLSMACTLAMKSWFRVLAAAFKSPAPATAVAGLSALLLTLYTGYSLPQPYMHGALKWITWVNPLRYGFEALMVNELHHTNAECASLIPQGPAYANISLENQVCTTVGSVSGQSTVSGLAYAQLAYDYSYSNLWMNSGILIVFGVGFVAVLLLFSEFNQGLAGDSTVMLFKRGSKTDVVVDKGAPDEEKGNSASSSIQRESGRQTEKMDDDAFKTHETFSFQHLDYVVPVAGGTRQLLDDVSGYVRPGKLTALMGESGAGKTTLLNVLAERTTGGVVTGDRFMNGYPLPSDFQAHTGYVQQMDTHLPASTIREALLFSACLRQPQSVPLKEKQDYAEKVLRLCGLEAYGDAVIGSLGVEHRKRTTIAVELVAKPSLIFLDEPTSGLDSQSAWAITNFLRDLADAGQAIVCTIHQPSAELFQVFDRLLLLKKGGQTVYFGDIGERSSTLINYFERNGARKCGDDENPAEYILDAIGAGATANSTIEWHPAWKRSQEAIEVQRELEIVHAEGRAKPAVVARSQSDYSTSWLYQTGLLLRRDAAAHWRDPTYMLSKLMLNIAGALFIGFSFYNADSSIQGTQNHLFAIFMSMIISVALANQIQVVFISMRNIFEVRERHSKMYSWSALVTSQILIELPWNILGSSLYFVCWYWTVGFANDRAGFTYLIMGVLLPFYYTTIAQAVAAMAPDAEISALLFSFLFSFVLTFNGVLQPYSQLGWWRWMYRLSPYTYLTEALLGQALGHNPIRCSAVELVSVTPPAGQTCAAFMGPWLESAGGYLADTANGACEYCAYATTDAFLGTAFNIFYDLHWRDFGIFAAFVVFNVACIYVFTYFFRVRTGSLLSFLKRRK